MGNKDPSTSPTCTHSTLPGHQATIRKICSQGFHGQMINNDLGKTVISFRSGLAGVGPAQTYPLTANSTLADFLLSADRPLQLEIYWLAVWGITFQLLSSVQPTHNISHNWEKSLLWSLVSVYSWRPGCDQAGHRRGESCLTTYLAQHNTDPATYHWPHHHHHHHFIEKLRYFVTLTPSHCHHSILYLGYFL